MATQTTDTAHTKQRNNGKKQQRFALTLSTAALTSTLILHVHTLIYIFIRIHSHTFTNTHMKAQNIAGNISAFRYNIFYNLFSCCCQYKTRCSSLCYCSCFWHLASKCSCCYFLLQRLSFFR